MIPVYPQNVNFQMVPMNQQMYPQIPTSQANSQEREVENSASLLMRGSQNLSVERDEQCFQCYWDFRDIKYRSQQLGEHKVRRFQPNYFNACFCWPCKICCCTFNIPPFISNDIIFQEGVQIKFANKYHGSVFAKGICIGTYELQEPGQCCALLICSQPKVVITKAVTNEQITLRPNDSICTGFIERFFGCFIKAKEMYVEKNGQTLNGTYSRSCFRALFNYFICNFHLYDKLDLDFQTFIKSDADKILIYGAFLLLQENTNCFRGCFC
ncbi:hypothetical protein TTHERM_00283050 (macronuclear) [Tetrahymena thermophila SB210]|uniref:Uncharacterized protein n=1 Tax=Tetrahymena thermophila (strain SB210) TaxID=312017 RepID=I7M8E3_TETTS|nr:hypothetical protein TTHERM_00283050 [Tetrahymena thermophila SB210]EAR97917.1 hypothetical protein TTHERM_00283050 [Tetrahymena thermophila SB210]|eukprot:XP_001018162.1 hypothetical protein TTHERM_00283050 [Tetrahymena thermophila SB210]